MLTRIISNVVACALIIGALAMIPAHARIDGMPTGNVRVICLDNTSTAGAADTNENILKTCTIPGGTMGINGNLRWHVVYSFTNNANNKQVRIRFGGIGGTAYSDYATASIASIVDFKMLGNRGATNSQIGQSNGQNSSGFAGTGGTVVTSALDTTASQTLVFTCQKATAGDACAVEKVVVELILP